MSNFREEIQESSKRLKELESVHNKHLIRKEVRIWLVYASQWYAYGNILTWWVLCSLLDNGFEYKGVRQFMWWLW